MCLESAAGGWDRQQELPPAELLVKLPEDVRKYPPGGGFHVQQQVLRQGSAAAGIKLDSCKQRVRLPPVGIFSASIHFRLPEQLIFQQGQPHRGGSSSDRCRIRQK